MKNLIKSILFFFVLLLSNISLAQEDKDKLTAEMLLIADNFGSPGAEGATLQSSSGWFSSASTLEKWQVEVSVHGNALFVPSSKQDKLLSNRDFQSLHQDGEAILSIQGGSSNALLPTVYGGETDVRFEGTANIFNINVDLEFDAIDGLDKGVVLHAFPQVTVGLPFKTEIAVRYLPEVFIDDVGISTYGVGIKHNFSQYLYKRFDPEDFQFALIANYSNFQADYKFEPIDLQIANLNRIVVDADMYNVQLIGSRLYDNFEVMGGVGYTNSNFDYAFGGTGGFLPFLNEKFSALGNSEGKFKGNIGFNYYFNKFKVSTVFSASGLFNANVGLHYRFN